MSGTVDRPQDAGFFGTFFAKGIGGCPRCERPLDEPNDGREIVHLVCPGCETVLAWCMERDHDDDVTPTTKTAVRDLLIEANSVLNGLGVPDGDDIDGHDDLLSPLSRRIAWLGENRGGDAHAQG